MQGSPWANLPRGRGLKDRPTKGRGGGRVKIDGGWSHGSTGEGGGGGAQRSAGDRHIGVCLLFFTFNFQSCTSH